MPHEEQGPVSTEESRQRILMRLYAWGANIEPVVSDPSHLQLGLPILG